MIIAVSGGDPTTTLTSPLKFGRLFVYNGFPIGNGDIFHETNS